MTPEMQAAAMGLSAALRREGWSLEDLLEKMLQERPWWLSERIGENPFPGQRAYVAHHAASPAFNALGAALRRAGVNDEDAAFALIRCEVPEASAVELWRRAKTWTTGAACSERFRDLCIEHAPASGPRTVAK